MQVMISSNTTMLACSNRRPILQLPAFMATMLLAAVVSVAITTKSLPCIPIIHSIFKRLLDTVLRDHVVSAFRILSVCHIGDSPALNEM